MIVTRTLFALIALLHLVRMLTHSSAVIGGWAAPLWISGLAFVVAGALSVWSAQLSRRLPHAV
ncbi:MAG: hypothetical protein ACM3NS_08060 [Deltaproteobacteria bacterium]